MTLSKVRCFALLLFYIFSFYSEFVSSSRFASPPKLARSIKPSRSIKRDSADLDACGQIIAQYNNDGTTTFTAQEAYNCLKLVPFNAEIAHNFLTYYRGTLEFQSTLAYLRDPPASYQQPGVDVLEAIDAIRDSIDSGVYVNQYSFETDLQRIAYRTHDFHVALDAGIGSIFRFGSPVTIVAVSKDGQELPKPYLASDIVGNDGTVPTSPISNINGKDATEYLTRYATIHSRGMLESHGDWNILMDTPASSIQNTYSTFAIVSPFYPGQYLNIKLENGTVLPRMEFQATANFYSDLTGLRSAQDLYDYFVPLSSMPQAGSYSDDLSSTTSSFEENPTPTSTDLASNALDTPSASTPTDDSSSDDTSTDPTLNSWTSLSSTTAYPQPDVFQPNLGFGGWITGYFLNATRTGVISIPSFHMTNEALNSFSDTVGEFLSRAQAAGMKRIVVDLQQNTGGSALLAVDVFKHFFPNLDIGGGSRLRAFEKANVLGTVLTPYLQQILAMPPNHTYVEAALDDPWAVGNYIDVNTRRYFQSWPEFFGPVEDHGDFFSHLSEFNYSDPRFLEAAAAEDPNQGGYGSSDYGASPEETFTPYGFSNKTISSPPPFAAENIVLLTDTLCASTCALFFELMHHIGGVRSVTVGGLPQPGPIQAVGSTRGAQWYNTFDIDSDMYVTTVLDNTTQEALDYESRVNLNFTVTELSFNLRDSIRQSENFPLQFAYEAADCRIFWTRERLNDFTKLWNHAAEASWDNADLCVADSKGFTKKETDTTGPKEDYKKAWSRGQTIAQSAETMSSNNKTSTDSAYDTSAMAHWILGGIGGSLQDGPGGWGGGNGQQATAPNDCFKPGYGCVRNDEECVYSVTCNSKGTYDISRVGSCRRRCQSACGTGANPLICNREYHCTPGASTCSKRSFCEAPITTKCTPQALQKVQNEISQRGTKAPHLIVVPNVA